MPDSKLGAKARALACPLLVATGAALPLMIVLLGGSTLAWQDSRKFYAPMRPLVVEALRHLRLPLWNPHEALGIPLFAQMLHAVLHPFSVLAAFVAPTAGPDVFIVAHVMAASVGAFVLSREAGASRAASAIGGLGFGLSGYVLSMSNNLLFLGAAGAAPWAAAGIACAGRGARFGVAAAAAGVAIALLAGDPQWALVAVALGIALASKAGGRRGAVRATAGIAIGFAVAGIQLVPAWTFLQETTRGAGLTAEDRMRWALAPWRLLELFAPGFFTGRPGVAEVAPVFQQLGGPNAPFTTPFVPSVALGSALLVLAVAGIRASRVLWIAAALLLWMAMGHFAGADRALGWVPVWGSIRYSEKLIGPVSLCIAVLGALGADRLGAERRVAQGAGAVAVALAAVAAVLLHSPLVTEHRLGVGLVHAAVGLAVLSGLQFAGRGAPAVLAVLVALQGISAAPFALHAGVRGLVEPDPLAAVRGQLARLGTPAGVVGAGGRGELDYDDRLAAVASRMAVEPFNVPAGFDEIESYASFVPRRFGAVSTALGDALGNDMWIALRRFGLTHVVVGVAAPEWTPIAAAAVRGAAAIAEDADYHFVVWQVPHRPWAYFAPRAVQVASAREAVARLASAPYEPEVVIEGPVPDRLAPGRVLSVARHREELHIEAESAGEGFLVVNDAYWPGWKAAIDGDEVPILPADALVRAVRWPAGRHALIMRYEPPELAIGIGVTIAGLAALLAAVVAPVVRRAVPEPRSDQ